MKKLTRYLLAFLFIFSLSTPGHCREYIFSTYPFANPVAIHKRFEPLVSYLAKENNISIAIRIAPNYLAHVKALGTGQADLGFAGPSPYVRAKDKYGGIELLARLKVSNDRNDKIVFISRLDSPCKTISDLKGKSFAFGDHQSFGSHFMPRWLLHQNGLSLRDFTDYDFVKSHDNVILSVLHGDFDAGGVRLDVFKKYKNRPLKILAGPFAIPPHVIVCRTSLDKSLKDKILQSLLALQDPAVLKQITPKMIGFGKVRDSDFNLARKVINFVEAR